MSDIQFSKRERELIAIKLQNYFESELDHDLGGLEADLLLNFLSESLGSFYYNRGLYDAEAILKSRTDDITSAILDLEKPQIA